MGSKMKKRIGNCASRAIKSTTDTGSSRKGAVEATSRTEPMRQQIRK